MDQSLTKIEDYLTKHELWQMYPHPTLGSLRCTPRNRHYDAYLIDQAEVAAIVSTIYTLTHRVLANEDLLDKLNTMEGYATCLREALIRANVKYDGDKTWICQQCKLHTRVVDIDNPYLAEHDPTCICYKQ